MPWTTSSVAENRKSGLRAAKSGPRAAQEPPKELQERPKSCRAQERPRTHSRQQPNISWSTNNSPTKKTHPIIKQKRKQNSNHVPTELPKKCQHIQHHCWLKAGGMRPQAVRSAARCGCALNLVFKRWFALHIVNLNWHQPLTSSRDQSGGHPVRSYCDPAGFCPVSPCPVKDTHAQDMRALTCMSGPWKHWKPEIQGETCDGERERARQRLSERERETDMRQRERDRERGEMRETQQRKGDVRYQYCRMPHAW